MEGRGDRLCLEEEVGVRKGEETRLASSGVLSLNNRKDEVAIYLDGGNLRERGLGSGGQVLGLGLAACEMPWAHSD